MQCPFFVIFCIGIGMTILYPPSLPGGWRIVIPMPEAINFVDGRRQKSNSSNVKQMSVEKNRTIGLPRL
jgi:hypothetical protein